MHKTLAEIAKAVDGRVVGDGTLKITGISGIKESKNGDLTFLANPKYLQLAQSTLASAIIVEKNVVIEGKSVIQTDNPSLAFSKVVAMIKEDLSPKIKGVHPSAVVAPSAVIHPTAGVGPTAVIETGAHIGAGSIICAGVYIGQKTVIGDNCLIYPNVTIREEITIGNNVIIHSGSVVGSDGFGYMQIGDSHIKIPQTGVVVIEDDVELGACVTIDRARFDKTVIGRGTKIDNLVQVAHNVILGKNCIMVAQSGVAGSSTLGNNVTLAGQVGVTGHITVGDRVVVAAQSGVTKSFPAGKKLFGTPAADIRETINIQAHSSRLPEYAAMIKELKARVEALEAKLKDQGCS